MCRIIHLNKYVDKDVLLKDLPARAYPKNDSITQGQRATKCLRESHPILMLDNVIRLKNAKETTVSRGVHKSWTLGTLSVT